MLKISKLLLLATIIRPLFVAITAMLMATIKTNISTVKLKGNSEVSDDIKDNRNLATKRVFNELRYLPSLRV